MKISQILGAHSECLALFVTSPGVDVPEKDPRTYAIIGAAMQVHRELGPGHLESVYQGALSIQFEESAIPFRREVPLPVKYHGKPVGAPFRADFVCHESIIVELKATHSIGRGEVAQVANYLPPSSHWASC